ncbi:MAG TPA: chromosome segregation protein SMC [Bacteroidota bacterium]|nr:chromosome segregation protein SMC [Bacteroidota bacterium]
MYLSTLEIIGFKSFANKVNLAFDSGISAIVGPNGCGKTNIVDAIRWVLGEQRYSALRSDKMEDVIFNGTKARKALGMAEASLVIENTKGILPSEYTQVTIGRRVYRSGESEYLLNKVPCRLKDILDLFMDTGMGADAYSVIELKMIEVILSDKTDERRRLFEEAAGVTKYKHRRKAAYRKLESVQDDLVRVNDIVAEVQKAVATLERQARRAEQFNETKARLRTLEIDLMEREFAQLNARATPLEEKLRTLNDDRSQIDVDLSGEEARLDELRTRLLEAEKRLAEAQRDVSLQREAMHRVEEQSAVAAERIRSLRANRERLEHEQEELHGALGRFALEREMLASTIDALRLREGEIASAIAGRTEALAQCQSRLDGAKGALQELNDRALALVQSAAERQGEQDRRKAHAEGLNGRSMRAAEESVAYEQDLARLDAAIAELTESDRALRRKFTEAEVRFYGAESRKKEIAESVEKLRSHEAALQTDLERKSARLDFLKGLVESREGLPEGVRYLASSPAWKASRTVTVADAVHAEDRFRAALEAALGEYAGLLVVATSAQAEEGMALLRDEKQGKATFVCLDRVPQIRSRIRLPRLQGVLGLATDVAKCAQEHAPLFRLLLDRVVIVSDAATADAVAARLPGLRCVTLDGEIRTGVGITRGGSRRLDEGGLIGKREQIEELQRETAALRAEVHDAARERGSLQEAHDAIELKAFTDDVKGVEKEMNGIEVRIAQVAFEKKRATDIIARNAEEVRRLEAEAADLLALIAADAPALESLAGAKAEAERAIGGASRELEVLEEERASRAKELNEQEIALVGLRGELQNAVDRLARTGESEAEARALIARREEEKAEGERAVAADEALLAENTRTLTGAQAEIRVVEERRAAVEQEGADVRERMHAIELAIKDRRRTHDDALRTLHEHELRLAELRAKADHIRARAAEEFELEIQLREYPADEFVDFAALRDEIQGLRDRVKSLGNINFAAFEEYTTEKQRLEFMATQRQDLLDAEKTLLATIEEINATAQRKFLETFALIRNNFIETFKSLFDPGDECDLKLEEGVDPLEARIEIVAKPRGKRPTSIDLLSGGEKTLTATALLFAIYLVKPSPFCILDEVDAPLDDANVDRFTRILRKFSDNTQFIVVTHNKRTMEAASALYGVTMEEEGVSKLVTVRFTKGARVESAALASA